MNDITVLTLVPRHRPSAQMPESVRWANDVFCVVDANARMKRWRRPITIRTMLLFMNTEMWLAPQSALPQVNTEWTLVLDADEWASSLAVGAGNNPVSGELRRVPNPATFLFSGQADSALRLAP